MDKLTYKKFIELSKWLLNFNQLTLIGKIRFYISAPIRFILFRKAYKSIMTEKIQRKEVK